jgi:hypothetical protein
VVKADFFDTLWEARAPKRPETLAGGSAKWRSAAESNPAAPPRTL